MGLFGKKPAPSDQMAQLSGALKSKEALSEILIQSLNDGIIVTDTNNSVILMNKAASDLTEWTTEEALKLDVRLIIKLIEDEKTGQFIADPDHPFAQSLDTRKSFNETLLMVGRNGTRNYVSLSISPIIIPKTEELAGVVAVMRNVNQQRKQEQRSADFISTASHEMRTPVAAIEGYLALALNDKVSTIDARAREYLDKAHSSTQHLGKLFQDLLTSAKAEDGRLTNNPVVIEIGELLEQLVEDMKFSAQKKGLDIEFLHGNSPQATALDATSIVGKTIAPLYYTKVDPDRMREVITNLFDNAVKYTESGKISIGVTGDTNVVQIRVADTGPGIPKEDLPHLFQKFYRVDNSATRSIGGTGLGLYICASIVSMYDGTIWADSVLGQGTTFYINLPRLSSQQAAHLQSQEKHQADVQ